MQRMEDRIVMQACLQEQGCLTDGIGRLESTEKERSGFEVDERILHSGLIDNSF